MRNRLTNNTFLYLKPESEKRKMFEKTAPLNIVERKYDTEGLQQV